MNEYKFHLDVKINPDHDDIKLPVESYSIEQNKFSLLDVITMFPLLFFRNKGIRFN